MNIRGERILLFGDELSHHGSASSPEIWAVNVDSNRTSSAPGDLLASMLAEQGATVQIDAAAGRSAPGFWHAQGSYGRLGAPDQLIAQDRAFAPTKVLVMLGQNDLGLDPGLDADGFKALKESFPKAEVWAIGPPNYADPTLNLNANIVYQTIHKVFGTRVIDLRPLTMNAPRTGDGLRFTGDTSRAVAQSLLQTIAVSSPLSWGTIALGALGLGALVGVGLLIKRHENRMHAGMQGVLEAAGEGEIVIDHDPHPELFDDENVIDAESVELGATKKIDAFGYELDINEGNLSPRRSTIDTSIEGDYGADPLGDGTFRMVPSGDIVDFDERTRRLDEWKKKQGMRGSGLGRPMLAAPKVLELPEFEILKKQSKPPHVARLVAEKTIPNEHGAEVIYRVYQGRNGKDWWVSASIDGHRMSNTLHTAKADKAQQWIEAVQSGNVRVAGGLGLAAPTDEEMRAEHNARAYQHTLDHIDREIPRLQQKLENKRIRASTRAYYEREIERLTAERANVEAKLGRNGLAAPKISTKDPATMTAGEINKELDKLDALGSKLDTQLIAEGRGHDRPSDLMHKTDPLSMEWNAVSNRRRSLLIERDLRYGPNAPSRLPTRGYGPRKKPELAGRQEDETIASVINDAAKRTAAWSPGSHKRFVSSVYETIVNDGRADGISFDEFKHMLVRLNREGLVNLQRADLVAAMDPSDVAASEVDDGNSEFHFISVDSDPKLEGGFVGTEPKILYETPKGYITLEKTGKSQSYIVWKHAGTAATRAGTFGTGVTNAFERAKSRLDELAGPADVSNVPSDVTKKWKSKANAYKKALAQLAAGDEGALDRAVKAKRALEKVSDLAAQHAGSYTSPLVTQINAQTDELLKEHTISAAEEQGRQARVTSYETESNRLREEEREAKSPYAWMDRGKLGAPSEKKKKVS